MFVIQGFFLVFRLVELVVWPAPELKTTLFKARSTGFDSILNPTRHPSLFDASHFSETFYGDKMSGSFLSTHPEPATTPSHTPSPPPSESLQSIYLPLKRTYAFYLALDPLGDQLHGEPSVLPNESTVPTTTVQVPPLHNRRKARTSFCILLRLLIVVPISIFVQLLGLFLFRVSFDRSFTSIFILSLTCIISHHLCTFLPISKSVFFCIGVNALLWYC
ncbi:hypothetical protein FRC03_006262 [Tulasnella sp. 419]|nr:hypothetical protein FRC03_006262 [Tulasnella sp. 419]